MKHGGTTAAAGRIRTFLLILFVLGVVGTGTELLLLEHTEDTWQLVPLAMMAISLVAIVWFVVARGRAAMLALRAVMALFVASGFAGVFLHYKSNAEFELEMYPSMKGFELFRESIMGAMPALAPGTMIGLGLLGLIYTYHHPVLERGDSNFTTSNPS